MGVLVLTWPCFNIRFGVEQTPGNMTLSAYQSHAATAHAHYTIFIFSEFGLCGNIQAIPGAGVWGGWDFDSVWSMEPPTPANESLGPQYYCSLLGWQSLWLLLLLLCGTFLMLGIAHNAFFVSPKHPNAPCGILCRRVKPAELVRSNVVTMLCTLHSSVCRPAG